MKIVLICIRKICCFINLKCNEFLNSFKKKLFQKCGVNVNLGKRNTFYYENMQVGNYVSFGADSVFMSSRAKIIVGDHVIFGPHVYVITGNHRYNIEGKYIDEVKDNDKCESDDQDVCFQGDNWIGSGSVILKGVTIGKGTIIGAGSIVTRSTEPNSIYCGNPARRIKGRFD